VYFAMMGEVILRKGDSLQGEKSRQLSHTLEKINSRYAEELAVNFSPWGETRFQGVFFRAEKLLEALDQLRILLEPWTFRFGIGIGAMDLRSHAGTEMRADGPALWNAEEALRVLESRNDYGVSKVLIKADEHDEILRALNENARLCDFIESRWRGTQKTTVDQAILHHGHDLSVKQTELAELLGISSQALNQRIKSSGFYTYLRAKKEMARLLDEVWGEGETR
jgi:hypothetical protein